MSAIVDFFLHPSDATEAGAKLDLFARFLSIAFLAIGIVRAAMIIGLFSDPDWRFETMSLEWRVGIVNLTVADLVAAVGLWMRVSWGHVIWIYAVIAEVAMHTVFAGYYGVGFPMLAFHVLTAGIFTLLYLRLRRAQH